MTLDRTALYADDYDYPDEAHPYSEEYSYLEAIGKDLGRPAIVKRIGNHAISMLSLERQVGFDDNWKATYTIIEQCEEGEAWTWQPGQSDFTDFYDPWSIDTYTNDPETHHKHLS